jgi:hypothetical protein
VPNPNPDTVVVGGHDPPVVAVTLSIDTIQTAHELGGVLQVAELLEGIGERCDTRFLILLAGVRPIAFDGVNHLARNLVALEIESGDGAEIGGMALQVCLRR